MAASMSDCDIPDLEAQAAKATSTSDAGDCGVNRDGDKVDAHAASQTGRKASSAEV